MSEIYYRRANASDALELMRLYQIASTAVRRGSVLLDFKNLRSALEGNAEGWEDTWFLGEKEEQVVVAASLLREKEHQLCKINRVYVDPGVLNGDRIISQIFEYIIQTLQRECEIEVAYTTTHALTLTQLELTLGLGFQVLGIFPNAVGVDASRINGIVAYFFGSVLEERRFSDFSLHPALQPFYEIVRKGCALEALKSAELHSTSRIPFENLPVLEAIDAPTFVMSRFERLREKQFLSVNFYPFQLPNTLITDPEQKIEIFARVVPELRFASVIGERLDRMVNPASLYDRVFELLFSMGAPYVEVLSDASDALGIQYMLDAGFIPSTYFPGLKNSVDVRRDYVVLSRSHDKFRFDASGVPPIYLDFLREYANLDLRSYLPFLKASYRQRPFLP